MPKRRAYPKSEKRTRSMVGPFSSQKVLNRTACMNKQPHTLTKEYVTQRIDYGVRRGINGEGQYSGKDVPDDLVFEVCTNLDHKGNKCSYRVCVGTVEAF